MPISINIEIQFIDAFFRIYEMEVHVRELTLFQITFANVCKNGLILSELMHSYVHTFSVCTPLSDLYKYYACARSDGSVYAV